MQVTPGKPCRSRVPLRVVGECAEEIQAMKDAAIVKTAGQTFWGGYAGYFQDPDGHLWEIVWNPAWPDPDRDG
jgi:uncharacterized glyoxalase superfamily protein PhnB